MMPTNTTSRRVSRHRPTKGTSMMNLSVQFQQWLNCLTLAFHHLLKIFFPESFPTTIRLNMRIAFQPITRTATVKPSQQNNCANGTFSPQEFFQDTLALFDTDEEVLAIAKDLDFKHELSNSYPYESPKLLDEIQVYEVLSLQHLYNELDQLDELLNTLNKERSSEDPCTRQYEERSIVRPTNKDKAIQRKGSSKTSLLIHFVVLLGLVGFVCCIHFLGGQLHKAKEDDRSILPLHEDLYKFTATDGTKTGKEIIRTTLGEDDSSTKGILTSSATSLLATSKNFFLTSSATSLLATSSKNVVKETAGKSIAIDYSIRPKKAYLKKTIQERNLDEFDRGEVIHLRRRRIYNLLVKFCVFFLKIKTKIKKLLHMSKS